jgi:hypothetical protein
MLEEMASAPRWATSPIVPPSSFDLAPSTWRPTVGAAGLRPTIPIVPCWKIRESGPIAEELDNIASSQSYWFYMI